MGTHDPFAVWAAIAVAAFLAGAAACHLIWVARMTVARAVAANVDITIVEDGPTTMARALLTTVSAAGLMFLTLYATGAWSPQQTEPACGEQQAHQLHQQPTDVEATRVAGDLHSRHQPRLQLMLLPLTQADQNPTDQREHHGTFQIALHGRRNSGDQSEAGDDCQRNIPAVGLPVSLHASPSPAARSLQLNAEAR